MAQRSAGLLMYRRSPELQVFLIHPGGPFFAHKRKAVWSLPKGLVEEGEEELAAAVREFTEETGIVVEGPFEGLGEVVYSSGKHVVAWAVEHDCPAPCVPMSNTFTLEWPRGSGRRQEFPEADDGRYFGLDEARAVILPAQAAFLDRLGELLAGR
jgi:predicted NUDIX family NTP pyrophosphohydrolase